MPPLQSSKLSPKSKPSSDWFTGDDMDALSRGEFFDAKLLTKAQRKIGRALRKSAEYALENPTLSAFGTTSALLAAATLLKHPPRKILNLKGVCVDDDRQPDGVEEGRELAKNVLAHYRDILKWKSNWLKLLEPRPSPMVAPRGLPENAVKYARTFLFSMLVLHQKQQKLYIIPQIEFRMDDKPPLFPEVYRYRSMGTAHEINRQLEYTYSEGHTMYKNMMDMIAEHSPEIGKLFHP